MTSYKEGPPFITIKMATSLTNLSRTSTNGYFLKSGDCSRHFGKHKLSMNGTVTPIISAFLSRNNMKLNKHNRTREEAWSMCEVNKNTYRPTNPTL